MSLAELSRVTRIPVASLEAIESDRFDELPGEVFVRGFLKVVRAGRGPGAGRGARALHVEPPRGVRDAAARADAAAGRPRGAGAPLRRRHRVRAAAHPPLARAVDRAQAARARHADRAVAERPRPVAAASPASGEPRSRARRCVVRTVEVGEADIIVTLVTEQVGKLSAIVRGARGARGASGGALEPVHTLWP